MRADNAIETSSGGTADRVLSDMFIGGISLMVPLFFIVSSGRTVLNSLKYLRDGYTWLGPKTCILVVLSVFMFIVVSVVEDPDLVVQSISQTWKLKDDTDLFHWLKWLANNLAQIVYLRWLRNVVSQMLQKCIDHSIVSCLVFVLAGVIYAKRSTTKPVSS